MFSGKFWKIRKFPEVYFLNILRNIPEYSVEILNIQENALPNLS
jgi:hypothetical protein